MTSMKVVHIVNVDVGVRIHLKNQLRFLQEQGYDVTAICSPGPILKDIRLTWELFRLFQRKQFDIVHTHSVKPGLFGRFAARLARVPHIVHTVHGLLLYDGMPHLAYWLWKISELAGARFGHYALSQSRQDMQILLDQNIYRQDTIGYLGNGIDLTYFDPSQIAAEDVATLRRSLGIKPEHKVIAIVGRLNPDKGYREFGEMARNVHKEYPHTRFWILGRQETDKGFGLSMDDIITDDMREYVSYLGLRSDMPQIYAAMDVFVFPSHHEGFPRSLMEASAMGVPIVATDIRGCREVVAGDQTGLLVPPRDSAALAEAVKRLLVDDELANRLGATARQSALEHFDERDYFERIAKAYEMLLSKKGVR